MGDESVAQQKAEATAENNSISNCSSDYMACVLKNRECFEKGSDAQVMSVKTLSKAGGELFVPEPKVGGLSFVGHHIIIKECYVMQCDGS